MFTFSVLCDIFAYSCLKLKPIHNLWMQRLLFKPNETGFKFDCCTRCSIFERSIAGFDWQNFGVSSIKFDYRTQSKSIERLEFDWVRLTKLWFILSLVQIFLSFVFGYGNVRWWHDNEFETKEKKIWTKDKIEPQQLRRDNRKFQSWTNIIIEIPRLWLLEWGCNGLKIFPKGLRDVKVKKEELVLENGSPNMGT